LLESGLRQNQFKIHTFRPDDDCLVLRIICNSVHRFAGMPDSLHLAKGKLTELDEDDFLGTCSGNLDDFLDQVDHVQLREEEDALADFALSQEGSGPQQVYPDSEYHQRISHDEL